MKIPQEKIEEIRSANDIVEVVTGHVKLKKRGKNYIGLCPFHTEKTPSFTVSPQKQFYHCFGCGKGGNAFTFVMEMEKVSFVESVRTLAARVGIELSTGQEDLDASNEIEALYHACRFAGLHFYENLTKTDEGRAALEYFHRRGFSEETIRTFGLGYSLNAWDLLLQRATEQNIQPEDLLKAGLIRKREDGSQYDYFRGRAMFPIFSTAGRVIGFGARKMREDDPLGKYINSPETPIYNKSRVLFGLFHSKEAVRSEDKALLVEGYADLISLFQAGIRNVVASSGTALTEEQLQLLARQTKNLVLVYDSDTAGSNATVRGVDLALEQGFDVKIVELPAGEDPDSLVQKIGGKEFQALVEGAISFIDFKARLFLRSGSFDTPEGKAEAVRSIVQSIAKINDELRRNFYLKDVSEKYGIYESILYRELERSMEKERVPSRRQAQYVDRSSHSQTLEPSPPSPVEESIPAAERDILKLVLENPRTMIGLIFSHISVSDFSNERVRRIVELLLEQFEHEGSMEVTSLLQEIDDPALKSLITDVSLSRYEISKQWQWQGKDIEIDQADPREIARAALVTLKRVSFQKQIEENQHMLKEASHQGADTIPFVLRHQELLKRLKELESATFLNET